MIWWVAEIGNMLCSTSWFKRGPVPKLTNSAIQISFVTRFMAGESFGECDCVGNQRSAAGAGEALTQNIYIWFCPKRVGS